MWLIFFFFILMVFMGIFLYLMNLILSKKISVDYEKCSPFECGFISMNMAHLSFSMNYFLFTIFFLIFDIELSYVFPMISFFNNIYNNIYFLSSWIFLSIYFILILLFGVIYEWMDGSLDWVW
uniref:NADH-ubiquinone oxidoreductase chain 3 n=1 Tax=Megalyra sp. MM-2014 TaxID=1503221 RepID=A0A096XL92_9HYME|nr:NADH dehydrogenase subunit 3 [Megalyra sp. MM-2014]